MLEGFVVTEGGGAVADLSLQVVFPTVFFDVPINTGRFAITNVHMLFFTLMFARM